MANITCFRDILAWQKAHELVLHTYTITQGYPKYELFSLTSQMRRAAISTAANIVEGFRRKTVKDSLNFYNTAEASLEELKYFILLSSELKYIAPDQYTKTINLGEEVGKLLRRWIQSQEKFL